MSGFSLRGFSEQQLQGLDFAAIRATMDEEYFKSQKGKIYYSEPPTFAMQNNPQTTLSRDGIHGALNGGMDHDRGVDSSSYQSSTVPNSHLSIHSNEISNGGSSSGTMPLAIIGMSCRFPGGANNLQEMRRLCIEGISAWSQVPKSRYNADAFYHPNAEKTSSMNVKSGHFLEENQYGYFDASFFNISPNEAKAMDPRGRMHLEGAYEAFENAGIPIADLAGSDTSVFVGAFNQDYGGLMDRDPLIIPAYKVTGLGVSLLSNRISHWFDLKGPSVTLDTACSASSAALHMACDTLRTKASKIALVSGANLMLEPSMMFALSTLNFLSPDGKTYMFDQRANGYARGEGIGTIVLKPLSDALAANDPIHAVIRNTKMNQDGRTPGITLPSMSAQRALIEETYHQAGLDVADTDFFEAHGTGTVAGDRTEAEALATALHTSNRDSNHPIAVGSIKTLMGHCEGASGIAGVMHSVLALQEKLILPNCHFNFPSDRIKFQDWKIKVPVKSEYWQCRKARRASVNSFGYGGTNVHVIVEEAPKRLLPPNENRAASPQGPSYKVAFLSANDEESFQKLIASVAGYAKDSNDPQRFDNLVYTLGQRRSLLRYRLACPAAGIQDLATQLKSTRPKPIRITGVPRVCFVFTGQGAQWATMGCELLGAFPVYKDTMQAANDVIANLGASWSLLDEIAREPKDSRGDEASLSQPLCTALQIALVELLRSWRIQPVSVVGHSSGEIAAAYCAGMLSVDSAMQIAYYRGVSASELGAHKDIHGAMMAVGLSQDEVEPRLSALKSGKATVACINSPHSVTISGDLTAIHELHEVLEKDKVFSRKLRVEVAYHSQHMRRIAEKYADQISKASMNLAAPDIKFNSTVFPGIPLQTNSEYWVQNLLSPVRFNDAVQKICSVQSSDTQRTDIFVEIGPHSALAGPLKQICADLAPNLRPTYMSTLERSKPDVECMLNLAGKLFGNGVQIAAGKINFPFPQDVQVLTDLPSYPWSHSMRYWHESRISRNYLSRAAPPHDLLGTLMDESSDLDMRWVNRLRVAELPWLNHHTLDSEPLFPGAGYLSMAIEAARQKAVITGSEIKGYTLREISFSVALMVPDTPEGVEVSLLLAPLRESSTSTSGSWDSFRIISYSSDRTATEHCHGLISTSYHPDVTVSSEQEQALSDASHANKTTNIYEKLITKAGETGVKLGKSFQLLSQCSLIADQTSCHLRIPETRQLMAHQHESPHVVKPQVLDGALQVSVLAIMSTLDAFEDSLMPTFVHELSISKDAATEENHVFRGWGKISVLDNRNFLGDSLIADSHDGALEPVMSVKGAKFILTSALKGSSQARKPKDKDLCWNTIWKPDVTFMNQNLVQRLWNVSTMDPHEISMHALVERAAYFGIRKAFDTLTATDRQNLLPHHQHYLRWVSHCMEIANTGALQYQTPDWKHDDENTIASAIDQARQSSATGTMVAEVGRHLPAILRQEIDPLSVMMDDGLLDRYYAELPNLGRSYRHAARYVDLAAHKDSSMKILEIGAGTGSATSFILKALGGGDGEARDQAFRCSSFCFTDISAGFFEKAREKFSDWESILEFKTLNIEKDVAGQGFEPQTYDLVVASNVLHATESMAKTLQNVHQLLKPGGKLILVEVTNVSEISGVMIFGLLPGWWLGVAEGRTDGPLLTEARWDAVLQETGFTGLDICARDVADEKFTNSTMITTKAKGSVAEKLNNIVVVHTSQPSATFGHQLAATLEGRLTSSKPSVLDMRAPLPSDAFYVLVDDPENPILTNLAEEDLKALKDLFSNGRGVLWVTFGGLLGCDHPQAGAVPGFLRTLRAEFGNLKCVAVDCPSLDGHSNNSALLGITSLTDMSFRQDPQTATMSDLEYAFRDEVLIIPRLVEDARANEAVQGKSHVQKAQPSPLWQTDNPLRLSIRDAGLLDTFAFITDERMSAPIDDNDVEISVRSTALNFHDILVATGQLPDTDGFGVECSGLVTKLGENVSEFHLEQRVCALAAGCFGTHTRTSKNLVCAIPETMTFEKAATIPSVFSTSYYSLFHAARLQRGETILIHSAAGGVGQACIKLASLIGATIFVTVGTREKIDFIEKEFGIPRNHILHSRDLSFAPRIMSLTSGRGVDVIVNSLAGDFLRESWRCIAMFGRFIELGKIDAIANGNLGMAPFEKSASFIAVGFDQFGAHKDTVAGETLRKAVDLFARKEITPIEPITVYRMSEIEKAFRFMQGGTHMGKIVINVDQQCSVPVVPKALPGLKLGQDSSYLIVGGVTGIGAAFAKWMVSKWAAKHLILISRSGRKAKGVADLIQELEQLGATVKAEACDVADEKQLTNVLEDCSQCMPRIRGVIQGAMVLQDSIFVNMTLHKFHSALNPKIIGTWNLHNYFLSRSHDLDFFILLSSLAGINGNQSQSNYAAGNTFQDAFAYYRVAKGLPALSIDIGFVDDAGWTMENFGKGAGNEEPGHVNSKGLAWAKHITTEHLLLLISHHILNSSSGGRRVHMEPQVSIGIEEVRPWDSRFSHVAASQAHSSTAAKAHAQDNTSLLERLATIDLADATVVESTILEAFTAKVSRLLDLPLEDIHHDESLSGHGVDSLVAVEIRNWLGRETGVNVPMSDVMSGKKTIAGIVRGIAGEKVKAKG